MIRNSRHRGIGTFARRAALAVIGVLVLTSCEHEKSSKPIVTLPPPTQTVDRADKVDKGLDIDVENPRTVAILPFVNSTAAPEAGETMRRLFYNFFSSLNFLDLETSVIDRALKKAELIDKVKNGTASHREICRAVGADALILGNVITYGQIFAVIYAHRQVTLRAEMIHCENGRQIWANEDTVIERDTAVSFNLAGVAVGVLKTFIAHTSGNTVATASQLGMKIVATIPNPLELAEPLPKIRAMMHNAGGRFLKPGEELRVALVGDPGLDGSWSPAADIEELPLKEATPGLYLGRYEVRESDRVINGRPIGRLRTEKGSTGRWIDPSGNVNFGAAVNLPAIIEGDRTLSAAEGPYIVQRFLIIPEGITLTMEAGTSVWTESGGLVVKGVLDVKGTSDAPVRLYGNSIERWKGILIDKAGTASQIRHARIVGADRGLKTRDSHIELENVDFIRNRWGMVVEGGSVTMRGGSVRLSEKVGLSVQKAQVSISNARFFENTVGGVQFKQSDLKFRNNEIHGNGEWEARNLDSGNALSLIENWWGGTRLASVRLEGDIVIEPALESSALKLRK